MATPLYSAIRVELCMNGNTAQKWYGNFWKCSLIILGIGTFSLVAIMASISFGIFGFPNHRNAFSLYEMGYYEDAIEEWKQLAERTGPFSLFYSQKEVKSAQISLG